MGNFTRVLLRSTGNRVSDWTYLGHYFRVSKLVYVNQGICVPSPTDLILNLPGHVISQKIKERKLKCEETIRAFITRINEVSPLLNAVVGDRFEEAITESRYIDVVLDSDAPESDEEKTFLLIKPLLGVPVTVKDYHIRLDWCTEKM